MILKLLQSCLCTAGEGPHYWFADLKLFKVAKQTWHQEGGELHWLHFVTAVKRKVSELDGNPLRLHSSQEEEEENQFGLCGKISKIFQ